MRKRCFLVSALTILIACVGSVIARGDGGVVLPASATPSGYSLQDMAAEMALFSTSGNDPAYYPVTPFQIIYLNGTNHV